ncbi:MAG: hypothetical protein MUC49_00115 [Raineya sp.]|jgi:hypothetical protein|nr:hypothetical protein [Raineya sp.]
MEYIIFFVSLVASYYLHSYLIRQFLSSRDRVLAFSRHAWMDVLTTLGCFILAAGLSSLYTDKSLANLKNGAVLLIPLLIILIGTPFFKIFYQDSIFIRFFHKTRNILYQDIDYVELTLVRWRYRPHLDYKFYLKDHTKIHIPFLGTEPEDLIQISTLLDAQNVAIKLKPYSDKDYKNLNTEEKNVIDKYLAPKNI